MAEKVPSEAATGAGKQSAEKEKCGIKMLREVAISSPGRAGTAGEKGLFKRPG